jgi:hypothetical protein
LDPFLDDEFIGEEFIISPQGEKVQLKLDIFQLDSSNLFGLQIPLRIGRPERVSTPSPSPIPMTHLKTWLSTCEIETTFVSIGEYDIVVNISTIIKRYISSSSIT